MRMVLPKELLHFQLINWVELRHRTLSSLKGTILTGCFLNVPIHFFVQTVSILTAIKCKNLPDTPSPTGTVNRVVQGVIIHPLEK